MDFKQIQELIKLVNKTDISEVKVKEDGFKITIRTKDFNSQAGKASVVQQVHAPAPSPVEPVAVTDVSPQPVSAKPAQTAPANGGSDEEAEGAQNTFEFKSPIIGTFYRSSSPDKDPFVKVGDKVEKGNVLCIIEAMKLFNEIECEEPGKIVKLLVEDSTPVEYEQPLFLMERL